MQGVSFKGLWKITGYPENVQQDGNNPSQRQALSELRSTKIEGFLNDTKKYRSVSGYSFLDPVTKDYYIAVSDRYDNQFADEADEYNIDCTFLGNKVARNQDINEGTKLLNKLFSLKRQEIELAQKVEDWKNARGIK